MDLLLFHEDIIIMSIHLTYLILYIFFICHDCFYVMLRRNALYKQCFKYSTFQHSKLEPNQEYDIIYIILHYYFIILQ